MAKNMASGPGGNSRKHRNHAHNHGNTVAGSVRVAGAGPSGQGMSGHIGSTTKTPSTTGMTANASKASGGKSRGPAPAPKGGKSGKNPV